MSSKARSLNFCSSGCYFPPTVKQLLKRNTKKVWNTHYQPLQIQKEADPEVSGCLGAGSLRCRAVNRKQKTEMPFSHACQQAVGWGTDRVWLVDLRGHRTVRQRLFTTAMALPVLGERRDVCVSRQSGLWLSWVACGSGLWWAELLRSWRTS